MRQADDYITFSVLTAEQAINDANFMSSYSAMAYSGGCLPLVAFLLLRTTF